MVSKNAFGTEGCNEQWANRLFDHAFAAVEDKKRQNRKYEVRHPGTAIDCERTTDETDNLLLHDARFVIAVLFKAVAPFLDLLAVGFVLLHFATVAIKVQKADLILDGDGQVDAILNLLKGCLIYAFFHHETAKVVPLLEEAIACHEAQSGCKDGLINQVPHGQAKEYDEKKC